MMKKIFIGIAICVLLFIIKNSNRNEDEDVSVVLYCHSCGKDQKHKSSMTRINGTKYELRLRCEVCNFLSNYRCYS